MDKNLDPSVFLLTGYRFDNDYLNYLLAETFGYSPNAILACRFVVSLFPTSPAKVAKNSVGGGNHVSVNDRGDCNEDDTAFKKLDEYKPLLFGKMVFTGTSNLLVAPGGVGKTLISQEIAKNPSVKRPAFILREDYSGIQLESYRRFVGDKALLITVSDWKAKDLEIQREHLDKANIEIMMQYADPCYRRLRNITDHVYSQQGLRKGKKLDDISIFEILVREAVAEGADFICLDSLNALLGGRSKIDRHVIERIIDAVAGRNITFLLIHHTNAKGEIYGGVNSRDSFDHVYELRIAENTSIDDDGSSVTLVIDAVKARGEVQQSVVFRRNFVNGDVRYEVLDTVPFSLTGLQPHEPDNLTLKIKAVIEGSGESELSFTDLLEALGGEEKVSKGGVKNALKLLSDRGLVSMADGKSWQRIRRN